MNQIDLNGRAAIITGGARGIGYMTAERMLKSGATVAIWDIEGACNDASAKALSALGKITAHTVDLTDEAAVAKAVADTVTAHGKIDILVNNASITGGNGTTWELDPKVWFDVINVNLMGPYHACRHVVPQMLKNGYGRIVNIASVAGKEGNPNASHYSASKAALISLTKSLGKELATKGILVNAVTPAAARTEQLDQMTEAHVAYMLSKIPMGRLIEPEEVASMITWLSSEDISATTAAVFDITGGRSTY
jgi:NAD(P)-dependent dehydrogenase (short-subunit alcohol dehydrogenase family)